MPQQKNREIVPRFGASIATIADATDETMFFFKMTVGSDVRQTVFNKRVPLYSLAQTSWTDTVIRRL
jgi:hypothetical protein